MFCVFFVFFGFFEFFVIFVIFVFFKVFWVFGFFQTCALEPAFEIQLRWDPIRKGRADESISITEDFVRDFNDHLFERPQFQV